MTEEPKVTCKGEPMRTATTKASETLKGWGAWSKALPVLKDHSRQPRLQCPAKLSAMVEGERKSFHDIHILRVLFPPNQPSREYWKQCFGLKK